jgi:hypothetical protein
LPLKAGTANHEALLMAIVLQNAIKPGFLSYQAEISRKTYEVLTAFYAKQTQFPKSPNDCNLSKNNG